MDNSFSLKTKVVNSKEYLFDELRKKYTKAKVTY